MPVLADAQEVGPKGLMIIAGVCFLVGVWFSVAVVSARLRAVFRWGDYGRGPAMSPLGAAAAALSAYLFAAMLLAQALEWRDAAGFIFYLVFAAIGFAVLVAIRDHARKRI